MKVLSANQTKEADRFTIENEPIESLDLMERASRKLFDAIVKRCLKTDSYLIFAGSGNNGGDALALARMLYVNGYNNINIWFCKVGQISFDCQINYDRLNFVASSLLSNINENDEFPVIHKGQIVIDGIFGSGLSRSVCGYWGSLIKHINTCSSTILSIDIPSGLFIDDNKCNEGEIIKADVTLTFQYPKKAFFFADNDCFVGSWEVLDIGLNGAFLESVKSKMHYVGFADIANILIKRSKFSHKGTFGHAFLIAGSFQKMGAAVLSAKSALRSGLGLLTVHVPLLGYNIIQTAVPEAMVCIDETESNYCKRESLYSYNCIGVGPGIGLSPLVQKAFLQLIKNNTSPMVFDADALNILSINKDWFKLIRANSIFTPHPGEFDRLTKKHNSGEDRLLTQIKFSVENNVIIVLKGAYTTISTPDGDVFVNSTGNSGMSTAGSGDVLTGIILSLLAQGYNETDAAIFGVFIHGLAGDIAAKKMGVHSLIASDIIENLGKAFVKVCS